MSRVVVLGSLAESLLNFRGPLLAALVEAGHEVHGVAPAADPGIIEELNGMGVQYHSIPLDRTGLGAVHDLASIAALVTLFRRLRPDHVLAYTIKPVVYGGVAARLGGVPHYFAMITGLGYAFSGATIRSRLVGRLVRPLYRLGLGRVEKVFFQNPENMRLFLDLGLLRDSGRAVLINGSGVDLQHFTPRPFPEQMAFLMIARLLRDKGIAEYVEAARLLKRRYPEISFRVAGWIDDNPEAISQEQLDAWVREGVVEYLGRLDDVRPAIAEASVYCLPSYHEGMPRTVLEAMAMGRPIITTDVPGCRSTVDEGKNGFLVPAGDPVALARAMEQFVLDPGLVPVMGEVSRRVAEERFDVVEVNRKILSSMGLDGEEGV